MPMFDGFLPPTERIVLQNDFYRVEIWPQVCGSVARFDALGPDGRVTPLFRPTANLPRYDATDLACWPLIPYSNRIAHGAFDYDGKNYKVSLNVEGLDHPLHGVGWQRSWKTISQDNRSCTLRLDHEADHDWPFHFSAEEKFLLTKDGLTITTTLTNKHNHSIPYGFGQHPYIVKPPGTKIHAQVKGMWITDAMVLPIDHTIDLPHDMNLPGGCLLDDVVMDHCFSGPEGPAEIVWPDNSRLIINGADNLDFLIVYNPPGQAYVCVEHVSHMTDAINRAAKNYPDTGLRVLEPNEIATTEHRFTYQRG